MKGLVFKLNDLHRQRIARVGTELDRQRGGESFSVTHAPHLYGQSTIFLIPLSSL